MEKHIKIVKASSGKTRITLSKKEWEEIGKTAGWLNSLDEMYNNVKQNLELDYNFVNEEYDLEINEIPRKRKISRDDYPEEDGLMYHEELDRYENQRMEYLDELFDIYLENDDLEDLCEDVQKLKENQIDDLKNKFRLIQYKLKNIKDSRDEKIKGYQDERTSDEKEFYNSFISDVIMGKEDTSTHFNDYVRRKKEEIKNI